MMTKSSEGIGPRNSDCERLFYAARLSAQVAETSFKNGAYFEVASCAERGDRPAKALWHSPGAACYAAIAA